MFMYSWGMWGVGRLAELFTTAHSSLYFCFHFSAVTGEGNSFSFSNKDTQAVNI